MNDTRLKIYRGLTYSNKFFIMKCDRKTKFRPLYKDGAFGDVDYANRLMWFDNIPNAIRYIRVILKNNQRIVFSKGI